MEKELPYSEVAEKQVLANMIFSSDMLIETLSRLTEEDFFKNEHKIIFKAIKEIYNNNTAKIEINVLLDRLVNSDNIDKVGGAEYILNLVDPNFSYIDVANAKYYINSVEERSVLRKLITYSTTIVEKWAKDSENDIPNYINKIEKDITTITKKRRVEDFISINEAFDKYKERLSLIRSGEGRVEGLATGYSIFDKITLGFKSDAVYILAARPSVGKSALALNFLYKTALKTSKPCVFFSLEMGIDVVTNRILAAKSGVPLRKIQTATFDKDEEDTLNHAMREISNSNLFIDETPGIRVVDIRSKLTKLQSRFGEIGLVVVDYIGLITPDVKSKKETSRTLEVGEISAALKAIARDFKCPVLILSQLNRTVEDKEKNKKPKLSNLRESGSLEQDADVVMFIHREDYGGEVKNDNDQGDPDATSDSKVELIIAKNRNGALATIDFMFQKHIGRFVEMEKKY